MCMFNSHFLKYSEHKMMMIGLHHAQLTSIDSVQSNIFEFKKAPTLSDEVNKLRNDLLCLNDIPVQKYIISSTKNYANILKQPIFEDKDTYLLTSNPEPKTIDPFIITPHSFRYLDIECCYQNDTSRVPSVFQGVGLSVEEGLEYLCLTGEKWAESYFVKSSSTENKPVTFRVCVDLGANVNARLINTGQIDQIILNVWLGGNSREFEKSLFITESDLFRNFDIAHQHTYVSYF